MKDNVARVLAVVLALWLVGAVVFGLSGKGAGLKPESAASIVAAIAALLLIAAAAIAPLRRWLMAVDLRVLVALHVGRFVGIAIMLYGRRRMLPEDFASTAGMGEVAVAITALLVLAMLSVPMPRQPRSLIAWNLFGLVALVMAMVRGTQSAMADPGSMIVMTHLPMTLLPTFLVPLLLATHVILFVRIWKMRREFVEREC